MRVKRSVTKRSRKKKVLEQAKGFRMTYHKLYRRAKEAVAHAKSYSHAHRKRRHSQKREEWIETIAAALVNSEYSYSKFIGALKKNNIDIDRKILADIAVNKPAHFDLILKAAK